MTSHVRCKGQYAGCLKLAHRGAVGDFCKPCRIHHEALMAEEGRDVRGKQLKSAIEEVLGPVEPNLAQELGSTRIQMDVESIRADAETGGHGVLTPGERFEVLVNAAESGTQNVRAYLSHFPDRAPTDLILVNDANYIKFETRQEIRDAVRKAVATVPEIRATYAITERALDQILAEPDAPKEEPVPATEPAPATAPRPHGRRDPEHMKLMRERRWAKHNAEKAELAELRAQQAEVHELINGKIGDVVQEHMEVGPAWKVTILKPSEVTIHASTLARAMATAQELYGEEAVVGIVKA